MSTFMLTRRQFGKAATGAAATAGALVGLTNVAWAAKYKYGNAAGPSSLVANFAKVYFETVRERTGGEVDFEIFQGNLGGEKTLIEGVSLGTLTMSTTAYTGTREFDIFYSPYFFNDSKHAGKVANGLLREKSSAALESRYQGRLLGVGRAGPWNLFLRKEISAFDDLKGMKIRAASIEGQVKGLKHLGAEPTVIAFNEVYGALQQGIVDGMSTLANLGVAMKFNEVAKYQVKNDFGIGLDKWVISSRVWDSLSKKNQEIVEGTFVELEETLYFEADMAAAPGYRAEWEKRNGPGTVLNLDPSAAQVAMEPLNKELADEVFGAGTWAKIQALA